MNTVTTGATIKASDINQIVSVLQVASGGSEQTLYMLFGFATTTGQTISATIITRSRGSTPTGATVQNQTYQTAVSVGGASVGHISQFGCQCFTASTAAGVNIGVAGNLLFSY